MIYLVGGAPRCGKSLLAREVNRRHGVPTVSTDLLRGVLMMVVPELHEAMRGSDPLREADVFYPHLRQAVACSRIQLSDQLIEGVGFFPRHVAMLPSELGELELRCCFLGHTDPRPEELFAGETEHRIHETLDDRRRAAIARRVRIWSRAIAEDCSEHGLPFVDLADVPFTRVLQAAEAQLFVESPSR
jgi:hypothetical protein